MLAIDFNLCRAQNPLLDQRDSTSVEGKLASAHATHLATLYIGLDTIKKYGYWYRYHFKNNVFYCSIS